jgi:CRP-like cAMP-binding protein
MRVKIAAAGVSDVGRTRQRKGKVLTQLGEGAHFGELALLGSGQRTATVVADSDVVLLSLDADGLRELLGRDLRLGNKLLWRFLQNLAGLVTKLSDDLSR